MPPASCFVVVFFGGVEITEVRVKPRQSGTLALLPVRVFERRVCFRSQDEVLARHQELSSALQFNGATS